MKRNRIKRSAWLTVAILMLSVLLTTSLLTVGIFAETPDPEGYTLTIVCYLNVEQDEELGGTSGFVEEKTNIPAGTELDLGQLVHELYANAQYKPAVLPEGGTIDDYWPNLDTAVDFPADGKMPANDLTVYVKLTYMPYDITWLDSDLEILYVTHAAAGDMPVWPGDEDPTKASDANYSYEFAGWSPSLAPVTSDTIYIAQFTPVPRKYVVTWDVGGVLTEEEYTYGEIPTFKGSTDKAADGEYTYTFTGWDKAFAAVTEDVTYTAQYDKTPILKNYTITFKDYDGSILSEKVYQEGSTVEIPDAPTRAADAQYTYTFAGWDSEVVIVAGDATYTATYDQTVNEYTITWIVDGVTTTETYKYGETPTFKGSTDKAADVQYTYTFKGWDNEVVAVTGDVTYTAQYTSTLNQYTVVFQNYDGVELGRVTLDYGTKIADHVPADPTRSATVQYVYTFAGWGIEDGTTVTGDVTYVAQYDSALQKYTVTWIVDDQVTRETYEYGTMPAYTANTDKAPTPQYSYEFKGWNKPVVAVVGNATYIAHYRTTVNYYTVIWDVDGKKTTETYKYGELPTFKGATDKAATEKYNYEFKGWNKTVVPADSNITYVAQYKTELNTFTVTWIVGGQTVTEIYKYGEMPAFKGATDKAADAQYTYTFKGWDKTFAAVTADATYTAEYTTTINKYTVTFEYGDGKTHTVEVEYGQAAQAPTDTDKTATESTLFTFDGWDIAFDHITSDLTVKAKYTEAPVSVETDPVTDPSTTEPEPEKDDAWLWFVILLIVIAAVIAIILLRRKSEPEPEPAPAPQPEPVVVPPVKEEPHHVEIVEEVSVDTVDELMSDAEAVELLEEVHERGGKGKMGIINLGVISPQFQPGDTITLADLKAKGLVDAKIGRIKILASGSLNKPLTIKADAFSVQAIKMITVTGGHAVKLVGEDK